MNILAAQNERLEVLLGGAITTTEPAFVLSYMDIDADKKVVTEDSYDGQTSGATAVTMLPSPSVDISRHLTSGTFVNLDTVAVTVTIRYVTGSSTRIQRTYTLNPGDVLDYSRNEGWRVSDNTGAHKITGGLFGISSVNQGDLIVGQSGGTWATLAIGAARQLLQVNAGGTLPEWTDNVAAPGTLSSVGAATLATGGAASSFGGALTVTGIITAGDGVGVGVMILNGPAGSEREVYWQTAGVARWIARTNSIAESGSNAGSNWQLIARDDGGALIDSPISIIRAAGGAITLARPTSVTGDLIASVIRRGTSDGADNETVNITAGGAASSARGARITLIGNEHANTGQVRYFAGNVTGGHQIWYTGNDVERMRLTDAGHFALGTTDVEAWESNYQAIEFRDTAIMAGTTASAPTDIRILSNAYLDATNWKYKSTAAAARLTLGTGAITLSVASTGTIDTAITWTDALTIANTGTSTFGGRVTFGGGSFAAGSIYTDSGEGVALSAITGSARDFNLFNPAGTTSILRVPTGTANVEIPNGHLLLGTSTVEPWAAGFHAFQVGASFSVMSNASGGADSYMLRNAYWDGAWKYQATDEAHRIRFSATGSMTFSVSASGAADTVISWVDALTITNAGESRFAAGGDVFRVQPQAAGTGTYLITMNSAITDYEPLTIYAESIVLRYRTGVGTSTSGFEVLNDGTSLVQNTLRVVGDILLDTNNTSSLQARTSGGSPVNLLALTNDANNITRFFAGVDAGGFQWTNQAASTAWMSLTSSGLTVAGYIETSANGTSGAGRIYKNATDGMAMRGIAGSSYDLTLVSVAGAYIGRNPTGTSNWEFVGSFTVSGTGPHAIGGAALDYVQLATRGTFTSLGASTTAAALQLGTTLVGHSGDTDSVAQLRVEGTITMAAAPAVAAGAIFEEPILSGAFTPTVASTVYVKNAPTEGTTNAAIYVASGAVLIGAPQTALTGTGDDFAISGSGDTGMTIHSGTSGGGYIYFGDSGSTGIGGIQYVHNGDFMSFRTNDTWDRLRIGSGGSVYINDTSNANMTTGLTINQGAADDAILALKSSDVGHGMTTEAEADTYGTFTKAQETAGGLLIAGYKDADADAGYALVLDGRLGEALDSTKSTAGIGAVHVRGFVQSGSTIGAPAANANVFVVSGGGTTRFILDSDGDSHQDVGTAWTNFDDHDDVARLNLLAAHVTRHDDPLRRGFGEWLAESRGPLEEMGLVQFNDDGHHFVNMSRLTMLHTGAIRQVGSRTTRLESALRTLLLDPAGGREQALALLEAS